MYSHEAEERPVEASEASLVVREGFQEADHLRDLKNLSGNKAAIKG